jgi:hypothetical protein
MVPLEKLHDFARYLEQNIVFGQSDPAVQRQMETELRNNLQRLSKVEIWRLMQQMLAGSSHTIEQPELDALYALQGPKDLYGVLRSIVLATHQKTGALTGRIGVHTRISAETEANALTNIEAVMRILPHVQPGNRLIITDMVKTTSDLGQLQAPDIFESSAYGQHRNGLVDNHAWNLQKLVRAIRDRGYQDRVMLVMRLDGPDGGANVNPFNNQSLQKYRLAIAKFIRYLETTLPYVPFKLILGNEPDLPQERQWSDPNVDARLFTLNQFAPATGNFLKSVARQRPDVTFICPALSALIKHDQLSYYLPMFGQERPDNLAPALHGYSADVATLPVGQKNLLEQLTDGLRVVGKFRHISGTEIGSGDPYGDAETLSERARFDDVVMWLLLSTEFRSPPGQDNNWSFRLNPRLDDPAARRLAEVINRTKSRVIRNIRERGGAGLQILRLHAVDRPAYGVEYLSHNTATTMVTGQTNVVRLTVRNTGYRTWAAAGPNPIRLGYRWYTPDGLELSPALWQSNRANLPYDVPAGETVTFQCSLGVPRLAGAYRLRWDMVEELRTWFSWEGAPTLDLPVTVIPEKETPPPSGGVKVSASHNNRLQGEDNLLQAIDRNPYTRWSSQQPQRPDMWFQLDLGESRTVSQIRLNNDNSPRDYPRGYRLKVSLDGQNWATVAENPLNNGPFNVAISPRQVRFIRIEQTGSDPTFWWAIHEIDISETVKMSASASHNNVLSGNDNLSQALDGRPETRWSSNALQQPGMWFELDLNETRRVNGLTLDTTGSPNDYPRGYIVRLSTDHSQWVEVARNDRNDRALDLTFSPHAARYIQIEQTGSADRFWWSIHEARVKFAPAEAAEQGEPLKLSLSASHNNVHSGVDNLSQALDGRPETRWSSQTRQIPGMWVEIDLNGTHSIKGLALDTAGSPNDYPRGYIVRLSTDHSQWVEVARNDRNDRALDLTFSPRAARYIRIEQTGSTNGFWWSIHGITIKK